MESPLYRGSLTSQVTASRIASSSHALRYQVGSHLISLTVRALLDSSPNATTMSTNDDDRTLPTGETSRLVRRACDEASLKHLGELYEHVAPSIYAWAGVHVRGRLRARLDPEDLLQEICFRAHRAFAQYDPERGSFRGWIFGIAHNVLREALRSLHAHRTPDGSTYRTCVLEDIPDDATSVGERIARDDMMRTFLTWTESLDDTDRRLLLLRGLEGRSHAEVAERVGLTIEVTHKRWQRLCARLRTAPLPTLLAIEV